MATILEDMSGLQGYCPYVGATNRVQRETLEFFDKATNPDVTDGDNHFEIFELATSLYQDLYRLEFLPLVWGHNRWQE